MNSENQMDNTCLSRLVGTLFGYTETELEEADLNCIENGIWDITGIPRLVLPVGWNVALSKLQVLQVHKFFQNNEPDEIVTVEINNHVYFFAWMPQEVETKVGPIVSVLSVADLLFVNN